jgi:hypothetical protein
MKLVIIIGITIVCILLITSVIGIGIVWWRQHVEEEEEEEEEEEVVPITIPATTTTTVPVPATTTTATVFKIDNQQIKSRIGDNICLEVSLGKRNNKAALCTQSCSDKNHQKFKLDDKQRLVLKHSNKCVAIDKNNQLIQWTCTNADSQKWEYDKGRLRSQGKNRCLSTDKAKVSLRKCNKSENQQWFI